VCEYDLALYEDKPAEPTRANADRTSIEKWETCDRMANTIIKQTPYELRFGKKPTLNYIRVWGCPIETKLFNITPGFKTKPSATYMYARIKFHTYSDIISE
jgi:hypothetical protein